MSARLSDKIKSLRSTLGLSQKTFCESLGISQGYLSEIEGGSKKPSETLIMLISYVYGVDIDWLKHGKETRLKTASSSGDVVLLDQSTTKKVIGVIEDNLKALKLTKISSDLKAEIIAHVTRQLQTDKSFRLLEEIEQKKRIMDNTVELVRGFKLAG